MTSPRDLQVSELPRHVGEPVTARGWVMTTRSSGKIGFVVARDGSGYLQAVVPRTDVPAGVWDRFKELTQETAVALNGTVRADARAPGGVELTLTDLAILGPSR